MAVSALSAARTLCELRNWSVSNLELQKILYLAHMYHLGHHNGAPLVADAFEAWDYGPVIPELYRHVKGFGSGPVRNVFHWIEAVHPASAEYASLSTVSEGTKGLRAGQLVANTHWDGGAWAAAYRPNTPGIRIHNMAILNEYRARSSAAAPTGTAA